MTITGPSRRMLASVAVGVVIGVVLLGLLSVVAPARSTTTTALTPGTSRTVILVAPTDYSWIDQPALASAPTINGFAMISPRGGTMPTGSTEAFATFSAGASVSIDTFDLSRPADEIARVNELSVNRRGQAKVGGLGDALFDAGVSSAVLFDRSEARLALIQSNGVVTSESIAGAPTSSIMATLDRRTESVVLVDGSLRTGDDYQSLRTDVYDRAASGGWRVIEASLWSQPRDERNQLVPLLVSGDAARSSSGPVLMRSPTTGRDGYGVLNDVAPTILTLVGATDSPDLVGTPLVLTTDSIAPDQVVTKLVRTNDRAAARDDSVGLILVYLILLAVECAGLAALGWFGPRWLVSRQLTDVCAVLLACTLATTTIVGLAPPTLAGRWLLFGIGGGVIAAVVIEVVAHFVAALHHSMIKVVLPLAVLVVLQFVDLLRHGSSQINAVLGYSPIDAGRFSGFGNIATAMFATAVVLAVCRVATIRRADQRETVVAVAASVVAIGLLGAPWFGSDLGAMLSLTPALILGLVWSRGYRVGGRVVLGAGVAGAAIFVGVAWLDSLREPADQTHLGRFFETLSDASELRLIVERKFASNIDAIMSTPAAIVLPIVFLVLVGWLFFGSGRTTLNGPFVSIASGLKAVTVFALLASIVNDSGIALLGASLLVSVPVSVSALGTVDQDHHVTETVQ